MLYPCWGRPELSPFTPAFTGYVGGKELPTIYKMLFMLHCYFDTASLKSTFPSTTFGKGEAVNNEYSLYSFHNVDNNSE